jgi:AcrR family transcriptional regulator
MANKVMNVRVTHTKESLAGAFIELVSVKDFEKITIADITQRAKVNRATFYAHFNDKYELLDYMMGDSASAAIRQYTAGQVKVDPDSIGQLVLAVCDFYDQTEMSCRSSYVAFVLPQLRDKMLIALKAYLLDRLYTADERKIMASFAAQAIHEGAVQWVAGEIRMDKEEVARKVAVLVTGGLEAYAREGDRAWNSQV